MRCGVIGGSVVNESAIRGWVLGAAAVAALAGCGTLRQAQGDMTAAGALPWTSAVAQNGAFMLSKARDEDLIYVSDRWKKVVNVYVYPTGERVGRLTGFSSPLGECVDRRGNIWIVDGDKVVEYAHGGTAPIGSLSAKGTACSINLRNGYLALTSTSPAELSVYKNAKGTPSVYSYPAAPGFFYCTYDDAGNIFITADSTANQLAELAKGASTIATITYPRTGYLGSAFWDGSYLVVAESGEFNVPATLDQVSVTGSKATIVSSIELYGRHNAKSNEPGTQYALFDGTIIGPGHSPRREARFVNFWQYPNGGAAFKTINERRAVYLWGIAVSPKR